MDNVKLTFNLANTDDKLGLQISTLGWKFLLIFVIFDTKSSY